MPASMRASVKTPVHGPVLLNWARLHLCAAVHEAIRGQNGHDHFEIRFAEVDVTCYRRLIIRAATPGASR